MADTLVIHVDGGSRGNPGPAAFGVFVPPQFGNPAIRLNGKLGKETNNVAEYTGLVEALKLAKKMQARSVLIKGDSELMVKQMRGEYKVKNEGLKPLFQEAKELAIAIGTVRYQHVYREQNSEADALCNEALDGNLIVPNDLPMLGGSGTKVEPPVKTAAKTSDPIKPIKPGDQASVLITIRGKVISLEEIGDLLYRVKLKVRDQLWKLDMKQRVEDDALPSLGQFIEVTVPVKNSKNWNQNPLPATTEQFLVLANMAESSKNETSLFQKEKFEVDDIDEEENHEFTDDMPF